MQDIDCILYISTKSSLILRDIDLLKKQKHLVVDMSLNTLDIAFWQELEENFAAYCEEHSIKYINAFNHTKLVNEKKQNEKLIRQEGETDYEQMSVVSD